MLLLDASIEPSSFVSISNLKSSNRLDRNAFRLIQLQRSEVKESTRGRGKASAIFRNLWRTQLKAVKALFHLSLRGSSRNLSIETDHIWIRHPRTDSRDERDSHDPIRLMAQCDPFFSPERASLRATTLCAECREYGSRGATILNRTMQNVRESKENATIS